MATKNKRIKHPLFLKYMEFVVSHENYAGMPDAYLDNGEIQWAAPSNRGSGKFQFTNDKRRDWWRVRARSVGISPDSPKWLSQTAKRIHPTKEKPCVWCGRILDIRYAYPTARLLERIMKLSIYRENFELDQLERVDSLVQRMVKEFGNEVFRHLPNVLKKKGIEIPNIAAELDNWLDWIEKKYIPLEPRGILSPGAMSNAPDRFDGFHNYNLCCRQSTDKGRSKQNLQSYTTDRRAFEYWVDGDWIAADRLMGLVRSREDLKRETCKNENHPGPCNADHIGPISLGFAHRPEFQLLCGPCNSSKNNRMYLGDILLLREAEERGEEVTSWYCAELWRQLNGKVESEETAVRLSKALRDNRHTAMIMLGECFSAGHFAFLLQYLELNRANFEVTFENVRVENHVVLYDAINHKPRTTKYATEQKARRIRVAFDALSNYVAKENRNALVVANDESKYAIECVLESLTNAPANIIELNQQIASTLNDTAQCESRLRKLANSLPPLSSAHFDSVNDKLRDAMRHVADMLASQWTDARYVREEREFYS